MEFKAIVTVVFMLLSLGLLSLAIWKARFPEEKTLNDIVESARNGRTDFISLTPPEDFNICLSLGGGPGCGDWDVGVEESCILEKDVRHIVRAYPFENKVCVNVTVMESG